MKIFFDTEFEGLYKDANLISIGLISENGKEFYAEINDINPDKQESWIKSNVLDNTVEYGEVQVLDIVNDENDYYVGDKEYIGSQLREWLMQFGEIELVSDVCHYDMVLLIDLFGSAMDLPGNVCPSCHDINQDIARVYNMTEKEAFNYSRELLLEGNNISTEGQKHNSMYDARVIKSLYEILENDSKI